MISKIIAFTIFTFSITAFTKTDKPLKTLIMDGSNAAHIYYDDKCSNGANSGNDKENFEQFIKQMLADKNSDLNKINQQLLKEKDNYGEPVDTFLGSWSQSFHLRDGCAVSKNSYTAFLFTQTQDTSNYSVAKYMITIDDDEEAGYRILKLSGIRKISIRK